jgi:hypothetical protein
MSRTLKLKKGQFDEAALDVEPEEREGYGDPENDDPPKGTILKGSVTRIWATQSSKSDLMLVVIFRAAGNKGDLEQYNDLAIFERVTFTPKAAFRYQPFLRLFGLTVADVKSRITVGDDEENLGLPVEKIAGWVPGSDAAVCRVKTGRRYYKAGERFTPEVAEWMPAGKAKDGAKAPKEGKAAKAGKSGKKPRDDGAPF